MTTNQPDSLETRLSRLETLFSNVGETVLAQSEAIASNKQAIDALTANINRLAEQSYTFAEQTNRNINVLAEQAERDRQQAAIDRQAWQAEIQRDREQAAEERQQAAIDRQEFRTSINQILDYLRDRNGGSPPPPQ